MPNWYWFWTGTRNHRWRPWITVRYIFSNQNDTWINRYSSIVGLNTANLHDLRTFWFFELVCSPQTSMEVQKVRAYSGPSWIRWTEWSVQTGRWWIVVKNQWQRNIFCCSFYMSWKCFKTYKWKRRTYSWSWSWSWLGRRAQLWFFIFLWNDTSLHSSNTT